MHDLRLVGVHEDGEHLLLTDAEGGRYALAVDEALRAAVRRDRAHLGQLQLETQGTLRPRDVQARIRAGATAEDVAELAGWTIDKVRRYEGPVQAERAHMADLARAVRVRRRTDEPVALGTLVTRRLAARGVDADRVSWDAWRPAQGPWVVSAVFAAGGRERQARWHFDHAATSITAADDEARWLSEDEPAGQNPLPAQRLSAVAGPAGATDGIAGGSAVYDIEADGGVTAEPRRDGEDGPLDLVGAMRSRRRGRHAPARRPPSGRPGSQVPSTGDQPSDVPGSAHHPAGRRRPQPEPLDLDPTLMDDPPAAHPPASPTDSATDSPVDAEASRGPDDGQPEPGSAAVTDPPPAEPEPEGAAPPRRPAVTRGRASMPSWDDIVFGAKRD